MKNYQSIILTILGFGLGYLTMSGTIQQYIHFSDVLNEMAFCVLGLVLGVLGLISVDYKKLIIKLK